MPIWLIVTLVVVALLVFYVIGVYNSLVGLRNRVKDQWAQVDVHLKRRFDLIPNLMETVKGYAKHEKSTFEDVIKARNSFTAATTSAEEMKASGELTQALGRLFALTENYPELKADKNFMALQTELSETEDKIAFARQFYNDTVLTYNNKVEMFPSNLIAGMFNFKKADFFNVDEVERVAPKVQF